MKHDTPQDQLQFTNYHSFSKCFHSGKPIITISVIIFLDFLMFYQTFFSPQVKRIVIISNKHGMCELPHELPNDLRLTT